MRQEEETKDGDGVFKLSRVWYDGCWITQIFDPEPFYYLDYPITQSQHCKM